MYPRLKPIAAAVALLTISASAAFSADKEFDPMVVTATRQATRASELLSDVTVIEREDIERAAATTVIELLARQPGIQMASNGGPGTSSSMYVRGANAEQTLILVDGIPLNSADLSGSPLRFMSTGDIEHIEIVRGPASGLYGADAIGGVVQIFTKKGSKGLKADALIGGGTYSTSMATVGISGGDELFTFRVQGNDYKSESFSARKNPKPGVRDADTDPYVNTGGSASFAFRPANGHEFGGVFTSNSGSVRTDSTTGTSNSDNRNEFTTTIFNVFSKNKFTEDWESLFRLGQSTDDQLNYTSATAAPSALKTITDVAMWQNDLKLPVGIALVAFEDKRITVGPRTRFQTDPSTNNQASLLGWQGGLGNHNFQINSRFDHHSQFGNQNTGGASYGYLLTENLRAHVGIASSFKAPSAYQLYIATYGNSALEPEQGINREAGLTWEGATQKVSAVAFNNRVQNLIGFANNHYMNTQRAKFEGVTLGYVTRQAEWDFSTYFDLLRASNEDTGEWLARRAAHKLTTALNRDMGAWKAGIEMVAVGNRYDGTTAGTGTLGGYTLINLTTKYQMDTNWSLEMRGNNITDKQYELADGYATAGANFFIGLRYTPK